MSKDLLLMRCVQNGSDEADGAFEQALLKACEEAENEKVGYKPCTDGELM